MCDPILVTLLKMRSHDSQSSRENATPSSGTSPLASYKEVPPPPRFNARSIFAIFLRNWTHCVDGISFLSQRYVRKGNDAKNPAILGFFLVIERTENKVQCSVFALAQKIETDCFWRNVPISNDPVVRISQKLAKNSLETTWMMYGKKIWILTERGYNKTGRFTANYENRFCHFF